MFLGSLPSAFGAPLVSLSESLDEEYLVNESDAYYNDVKLLSLFSNRSLMHCEIKKYVTLKADTWKKIEYYCLRCTLVHERATAGISDAHIADFRDVAERVLCKLRMGETDLSRWLTLR